MSEMIGDGGVTFMSYTNLEYILRKKKTAIHEGSFYVSRPF